MPASKRAPTQSYVLTDTVFPLPLLLVTTFPHVQMSTSNIEALLKRVAQPAKKVGNARVKFPWRARKKVKRTTLSKKDKEDAKAQHDAIWDSAETLSDSISLWNTFVSKEMKAFNEENGDRKRVSDKDGPIKALSERWKNMSKEERELAVADIIPELRERQENRAEGVQNVAINVFNDTRATLANVQRELEALNGRTNTDILFIAVRSKYGAYNVPYIFYSNDRVVQYTETIAKKTIHVFALGMEGFCLSRVTSLVCNQREELMDLKLKVKTIVFEKMKEACTRGVPAKMYYVNFEDRITMRYGLVIENYPPERFAAPGSFSSVLILNVLHTSWGNGITRFRELSNDEWQAEPNRKTTEN
ncbi:hypothetical protein C8Q80DRAFT_1274817 [Daedaleopsis nitida]|nr:hypothetical protein C8Q80DRAFT_1274817 [Daedaleopsis nitida]